MRYRILALCLCVCLPSIAQTRRHVGLARTQNGDTQIAQATKPTLPIKKVILYSNGVAYIERRGMINGNADIDLPFKHSQVDDVLKSMVVIDLGKGRVGAVSYNSSAPPSARLNDIPFSISAGSNANEKGGLAAVLKQLQGAKVTITTSRSTTTGSVLTVEERQVKTDSDDSVKTTQSVVIASDNGELANFDLQQIQSVRLLDQGTRRDVNQFAEATASARRRDAKTIVVSSEGIGTRELVVSYTVAAPIWKSSYRLILDSTGKPFFQGWAIVDNVSEEDWKDVSLTLVSGSPVSFVQPLQQPLYRYRPVIPIPDDLQLNPQVYGDIGQGTGEGIGEGSGAGYGPGRAGNMGGGDKGTGGGGLRKLGSVSEAVTIANSSAIESSVSTVRTDLSDAITAGTSGVSAAATGEEVGDLFEYHVDQPVTVLHDRSALIPILQTRFEGERVAIYNESARADRPMSGLRIQNTSSLTLDDGALTVLDGDSYAGESLLQRFKPGEKRLISFAVDLATMVSTEPRPDTQSVFLVKSVSGVLQVHYWQTQNKVYKITNQTDRDRVVYVEHPRRDGWLLSDETKKPSDTQRQAYFFRVELKPHETVSLPVNERRALMDSYSISNLAESDVQLFINRQFVNDAIKSALERILRIKGDIASVHAKLESIEAESKSISEDQDRLRDNIKALQDTAEAKPLIARYISKADNQETRIEQLETERKSATVKNEQLESELRNAIVNLDINRSL